MRILTATLFGFFAFATSAHADVTLKFGVYSADKATEMVKQFRPTLDVLEVELSRTLKEKVEISLSVAKSYEEGISSIAKGEVDLAQLGPVSYVQAKEANPKIKIVAVESNKGTKTFKGVIAVREDSSIKDIKALRGASFAFGDELSTIGRYLSQKYLMDHGIFAKDLKKFEYLGRHDRVGAAVDAKEFDAGALKEGTLKKMVKAGAHLRVLAAFDNVTKPWVARAGLDERTLTALRQALLNLKDETALTALGEDGFTTGEDADYASTREAVKVNGRFTAG